MVEATRVILATPAGDLDYASAKLALDLLVDPDLDVAATESQLDRLTETAWRLCGADRGNTAKLTAIQRLIYQSGPWNDHRPFAYDHADPDGTHIPNKLLHVYLRRGLGNCVSMPILFLILADRLGLDVSLATAPHHVFLRYRMPSGESVNLETTSGAYPARLEWYRRHFPMTDRALATGLYMRSLPKREGVALMATTILEHLWNHGRFDEVVGVAGEILERDPLAGAVLAAQGSAYGHMLRREFEETYPIRYLIPEPLRMRRLFLLERNRSLIGAAEALGWQPME